MTDKVTQRHRLTRHLHLAWRHRRTLLWAASIGLIFGLLVALSIPKEYVVRILLSPESISDGSSTSGNWAADILGGGEGKERDAITPDFYPYIVSSTGFLVNLFDIPLQTIDCPPDSTLTLYEYMDKHQSRPWWSFFQTAFGKLLALITGSFLDNPREQQTNYIATGNTGTASTILALSAKDTGIAAAINGRINIEPDVKSRTVTITCRMQDPLAAAIVADSLSRRIQAYITNYRTQKREKELTIALRQQQKAKQKYYEAQEAQADFEDRNRDLAYRNAQKEQIKLRILTEQAYQEYVRTSLQAHAARVKVIKVRPVFAVIQPATAPVLPSSPSKLKYMAAFALLGIATGYIRLWLPGWKKFSSNNTATRQ